MKLRIISGELGGRLIDVPKSDLIRPTTDRVRETLFNILNNKINFDGISVLDFYSGTGSLGIECISRGADFVTFIEKDFLIFQNLLKNITTLSIQGKCKVIKSDAVSFSAQLPVNKFDLILADPPFFKDDIYEVVEHLKVNKYFDGNNFMIIERSIQTKSKDMFNFSVDPFKIIGDTCLYEIS